MKDAYLCARALRQAARGGRAVHRQRSLRSRPRHRCRWRPSGTGRLPLAYARTMLGPGKIIGLSTHSLAQVQVGGWRDARLYRLWTDFSTSTKTDHDPVVGLEGLRAARALTTLPLFAIGGSPPESCQGRGRRRRDRVAVISAVLNASDPASAIRRSSSRSPHQIGQIHNQTTSSQPSIVLGQSSSSRPGRAAVPTQERRLWLSEDTVEAT